MALRIGPVGPVQEAGLGSGAGLGSEVLRCAKTGGLVPAMALVKDPPVSAHPLLSSNFPCPGGGRPIPNAAPRRVARSKLAGAAVRGQVCRVRKGGRGEWSSSSWASFGPGAPLPARSRHSSAVRVKAGAARQRARWGVLRRVWRSAGVRGERERASAVGAVRPGVV